MHSLLVLLCASALVVSEKLPSESDAQLQITSDPCTLLRCEEGMECVTDDADVASCQCAASCPSKSYEVCSTQNVTFSSECELLRQRCQCQAGTQDCQNPEYAEAQLDYYESCTDLKDCPDDEAEQFPSRARLWFFRTMEDLADSSMLGESYMAWAEEAKLSDKQWLLPTVWKYCELDTSPGDNHVTTKELHRLIALLKRHEPCLIGFLTGCDVDGDGNISLHEWSKCLGMTEDEAVKFDNHCDKIQKATPA